MALTLKILCNILLLVLLDVFSQAYAKYVYCSGYEHSCMSPQKCCGATCCVPDGYEDRYGGLRWSFWNMWYFWFIVIFILMSCFAGCGYWRRHQLLNAQQQHASGLHRGFADYLNNRGRCTHPSSLTIPVYPAFESPFGPSLAAVPPRRAAADDGPVQGMFPAPPPYTEVMSKPDVYPPSKDELPPYPGEPVITVDPNADPNNIPAQPLSSVTYDTSIPGLPPYQALEYEGASNLTPSDPSRQQQSADDTPHNSSNMQQNSEHNSFSA